MIWKVILLFCAVYAAFAKHVKIKNDEDHPLQWPSEYSVEARKYYMSSGLVENFKYWRSGRSSRLEVNDGAVIKISKGNELGIGEKYEIYPETTEEEINKIVCVKTKMYYLEEFLPEYLDELKEEGADNVRGVDCDKFTTADNQKKNYEITFWAYFNDTARHWVPVRYKSKKIDTWHGSFLEHEIWDYFNFKNDVNVEVFKIDSKLNCTTKKDDDQLSDRTYEKIKGHINLKRAKPRKSGNIPFPYTENKVKEIAKTLPKVYDLRLEGVVGPVLNTEDCKSSWAFATTAAVEGALARSNGSTWKKLSEQALLDCSWGFGNKGCEDGTDMDSYKWIMEHGLPTEQKYGSYASKNGLCKLKNMTKTYKIKGYTAVTPFNVDALKIALINHGPLTVTIDSTAISMYEQGVFYSPNCQSIPSDEDTVVTLVGYGERDNDTFWIIKNSKGPYWGTDGYIYISARDNNCGVMTKPIYVVV